MQQSNDKQRRAELGAFLRTRRARLSSTQIGMPVAPRRRTPGLRREEVAIAAGVSTTWYTYLEQGRDIQASGNILSSLANVLQLTEDERIHLFTLANQPLATKSSPLEESLRRTYQRVLDELGTMPALLTGRTYDILGWNRAATLVFGDFERIPASERNVLWLLFSKTRWSKKIRLFIERDQYAKEVLETFRSRITGHQADPSVQAFIERLQQASPTFRDLWAEHNVRSTCATRKQLQHPLVGKMTLDYVKFQVIEHPDIRCHMYLAADSETAQQLHRLLKDEPLSAESI
ncbi:helix-turn-helix transcriptional regulator [Ktedonospora formicarum]|uniref:Transcriptional regulator n=1 Tax=Ktedonospora formicarum TaxID=2778364 RepID=A0A8J3MX78_9CHLR|nr:helix-turn-helix transcriptional regulator [Ktedonospora formicarum]GHO49706.1 transcriptional regulator [Ktedonospora formicarum]